MKPFFGIALAPELVLTIDDRELYLLLIRVSLRAPRLFALRAADTKLAV